MKITSRVFGEVTFAESDVITFPEGLLGLHEYKRYIALDLPDFPPFVCLQSVEEPELGFIVVDPATFHAGYAPPVPDDELRSLALDNIKDALIYTIVVLHSDPNQITANLRAPLLINPVKKIGRQVALAAGSYSTKHYIKAEWEQALSGK